jgi:hypothetical protein
MVSIFGLFGGKKDNTSGYNIADNYRDLRTQVLTIDPAKMGLRRAGSNQAWGVLMEIGYPGVIVTLVTLADGTVSLYFSTGGGIIGVGQHEGPRKACESFLADAQGFLAHAAPTRDFPLPEEGNIRFYFLTFDGILTVEASEDDLSGNRLALSPLYHKAHEVITRARLVDEGTEQEQVKK